MQAYFYEKSRPDAESRRLFQTITQNILISFHVRRRCRFKRSVLNQITND